MKRAIIYTLVSTEDQQENGFSLRDQKAKLEKYCEDKGIEVVKHFEDDQSGKTFERDEFKKLIEFLKQNKGLVNKLLVVKWDRFSRNMLSAMVMKETLKKFGVTVEAIEQPLDDEIPENLLMEAIYLATPQVENARRSLNTINGMRRAMREGRWVSTPPKGYRMGRDEQNKPLMFATADAALIKEGFELYSTGLYSKCQVRKMLEKKGFKMSKNQFFSTLRNPLYYGKIFIPAYKEEEEELVQGLHQPIIDEELFQRCQRIDQSTKKNMPKPNAMNAMLPLRGHLVCIVDGRTLTGSGSLGNGGKYFYYHCQGRCKERFPADDAHTAFDSYISTFKVKPEIASLYLSVMEDIFIAEEGDRKKEFQKMDGEIAELKSKLIKSDDMLISGDLKKDSHKRMEDHYNNQLRTLQERKKEMQGMDTAFNQYLKWGFSLLINLPEYYSNATLEIKHKIVGSIFPEKLVFTKGKYRTNRTNEVLSLLCSNKKGLRKKRNGQEVISNDLPILAPSAGLEPATP